MKRFSKHLIDLVVILTISFVLLFLCEGILRVLFPNKVLKSDLFNSIAYEFNEDYLVSLKPNVKKQFTRQEKNGGYLNQWKTNTDSFRGDEIKYKPQSRVIVYGDSNIQARFTGAERTFPSQLENILQEGGISEIEVINAGVVGFGPDQSLIRFSSEVQNYKPDLVIFHVFADNDFGDIIRNRLFHLDENSDLQATTYKRTPDPFLSESNKINRTKFLSELLTVRSAAKLFKSIKKKRTNQKADNLLNKRNDKQHRQVEIDETLDLTAAEFSIYQNFEPRKYSHFADHYDIDLAISPTKESSLTKYRLMEEVIKTANELANANGIEFVVLIQPSKIDLTADNEYSYNHKDLKQYPEYSSTNLTSAVKNICDAHNIHSINLFPTFRENRPEELYFKGSNNHWTDRGQHIAAQETADYIFQNEMLSTERDK